MGHPAAQGSLLECVVFSLIDLSVCRSFDFEGSRGDYSSAPVLRNLSHLSRLRLWIVAGLYLRDYRALGLLVLCCSSASSKQTPRVRLEGDGYLWCRGCPRIEQEEAHLCRSTCSSRAPRAAV